MSRDFDFDSQVKAENKIDFKKVFFNPEQGLNIIRIVDLKHAQAFRSHFVKTAKGDKRFVKCPGAGCPLCIDGTNKPSTRYLLKVIARKDNTLKVWEFGQQIKVAIEEFVKEIKEDIAAGRSDAADTLVDYDIEVRRRAPGTNPLYALAKKVRLTTDPRHAATVAADAAIIAADTIKLADLVKPWSIERIKTQILGLAADAVVTAAPPVPTAAPAYAVAAASRAAVASLQQAVTTPAESGDDNDEWLHK